MVFSSYAFVFGFLPVAWGVFWLLDRNGLSTAKILWLLICSLFFYGVWNPAYLPLLTGSLIFNFFTGKFLYESPPASRRRRLLLLLGVGANLGLIGYFKYANFLVDSANAVFASGFALSPIVLPLAISFFTFQQIAYLVDAYHGRTTSYGPLRYAVFITFFPQLIAGPIVRHDETMPQISQSGVRMTSPSNTTIGLTIFSIGLFKKVILADGMASYANPVFDAVLDGDGLELLQAWTGAVAYSLQIYFDFSGYTDMAIGAARMFGIRLPINFDSPYRATSIIDFWQRWHITLSRFLRDYVYIPLGGNRRGSFRRYQNVLLTMLLGGLWHGAGWTFVLWGGLHGIYLIINHGWRAIRPRGERRMSKLNTVACRILTFCAVTIALVLFRSEDLGAAIGLYQAMLGSHGLVTNAAPDSLPLIWVAVVLTLACVGPNTQELLSGFDPALPQARIAQSNPHAFPRLRWTPSRPWALVTAMLALVAILYLERAQEFLYFQF